MSVHSVTIVTRTNGKKMMSDLKHEHVYHYQFLKINRFHIGSVSAIKRIAIS